MGRLFGTDGVRGRANEVLTAELALDLSVAAAHVLADLGGADTVEAAVVGVFAGQVQQLPLDLERGHGGAADQFERLPQRDVVGDPPHGLDGRHQREVARAEPLVRSRIPKPECPSDVLAQWSRETEFRQPPGSQSAPLTLGTR